MRGPVNWGRGNEDSCFAGIEGRLGFFAFPLWLFSGYEIRTSPFNDHDSIVDPIR